MYVYKPHQGEDNKILFSDVVDRREEYIRKVADGEKSSVLQRHIHPSRPGHGVPNANIVDVNPVPPCVLTASVDVADSIMKAISRNNCQYTGKFFMYKFLPLAFSTRGEYSVGVLSLGTEVSGKT